MSATANYVILAGFNAWFLMLLALASLERRDERERRREAHVRRLERECGLEKYSWGRQR